MNVEKQVDVPVHSGVPVVHVSWGPEFLRVVQGDCFLPISILYCYQPSTSSFTFRMMASAYTSRNRGIEAQRDVLQPHCASYHLSLLMSGYTDGVRKRAGRGLDL